MKKTLLIEELTRFYTISGIPNAKILAESKASEAQAAKLLRMSGEEDVEGVLEKLRAQDEEDGKYIPAMAYFYINGEKNIGNFKDVFKDYRDLLNKKRIKALQVTKKGLFVGGDKYEDFLRFAEFVHGKVNLYSNNNQNNVDVPTDDSGYSLKGEHEKIWSGNGIDVYDGNDVGKCIEYTMGGLTGKSYGFCIGQPGNTMWQSYRDSKQSTFYFIIDNNRELNDPLHIVVFDQTIHGVELTDANNTTQTIAEYGENSQGYLEYLESKGVPVESMFVNKPKTREEESEQEKLGTENSDLKWFMNLTPEEKSKYIGRGHTLTDDQFDYLLGK